MDELSINSFLVGRADCQVPLLDAIRTERNEYLLVFEMVDVDLQHLLAMDHFLTQRTVRRNLCRLLWRALMQLETLGVLHGDVKPANILVDGKTMNIKLCDFGLARILNETSTSDDSSRSAKDNALVTFNYRSVEYLLGSRAIDSRLDRWAGACVCHQIGAHSMYPLFSGKSFDAVVSSIFNQLGNPTADDIAAFYDRLPLWSKLNTRYNPNKERPLDEETCLNVAADPEFLRRCFHFIPSSRPSAAMAVEMLSKVVPPSIFSYRGKLCPSDRDPIILDQIGETQGPVLVTIEGERTHAGDRGLTTILYGRLPFEMATFLGDDPFLSKPEAQLRELGLQSWTLPNKRKRRSDSSESSAVLTASLKRQCRGHGGKEIQLAGHVTEQSLGAGCSVNSLMTDQRLPMLRYSAFRRAWFKKHLTTWKRLQRNLQLIGSRKVSDKDETSQSIIDLQALDVDETILAAATAHIFRTNVASDSEPHSFQNCQLTDAEFEEETVHVDGSASMLACGITPKGGGNRILKVSLDGVTRHVHICQRAGSVWLMTAATCKHQAIHLPSHSDDLTDFGALLAVSVSVVLNLSCLGSSFWLFVICCTLFCFFIFQCSNHKRETLALQSSKSNPASVVSASNGCYESRVDSAAAACVPQSTASVTELIAFLPGGSPLVYSRCEMRKSARKEVAV